MTGHVQILAYGDSLSWGIVPGTRARAEGRWPLRLEGLLGGRGVRVVEDCLNGRRTVFEDPYKPGRNGRSLLGQWIESCSPLALVVVMLGTNDFQSMHPHTPFHAARGIAALVDAIRGAPIEPGMPVPRILVVASPLPHDPPGGAIMTKFIGAPAKMEGLAEAYREVAEEKGCAFFDAGEVVRTSAVDGVHLDEDQHPALAEALAPVVLAELQRASGQISAG